MSPDGGAHQCAVLVIDDDSDVREMLRVALAAEGYAVATAGTVREGIDHLRSHADTCVILLDLMLPGMDGVQFRAIQRRDRSLGWIPVIVLSASVDADRLAREMGAFRSLRKPIELDALGTALGIVTGRNCRNRRGPAELAARRGDPLSSA